MTPEYPDAAALQQAITSLRQKPPLVTPWEIDQLREQIAEAQEGKRFVLQGGDCAESFADCRTEVITNKLKILLQMSLVLLHATKKPVTRIGRFAGQYAKPRSSAAETRGDVTLPSYFGDMFNRPEFTQEARTPDPALLVRAYEHSALTLNLVRALSAGGFADLHHPEHWDLSFVGRAGTSDETSRRYQQISRDIGEALRFMETITQVPIDDLTRVQFFTSHEGLNLHYEEAQTHGGYCHTTHMPWIGERTRAVDGAHVRFFSAIRNPIGVKLSGKADPLPVLDALNPRDEPGRIVLITRLGAANVEASLPRLVQAVGKRRVLWMVDPMHGNTRSTANGVKTRNFDDISREIELSFAVHQQMGTHLGGVHFELTGEDVTECIGGGLSEADLDKNYASLCDPRLNHRQALEMAFGIADVYVRLFARQKGSPR